MEIAGERWKDVPGWEGRYQVSDKGRVRSLSRRVVTLGRGWKQSTRVYPGRMLKAGGSTFSVDLVDSGKSRRGARVCCLVLEAFIGPCPDGLECCHYDDDPFNNCLENLRWDTHAANMADYARNRRARRVC